MRSASSAISPEFVGVIDVGSTDQRGELGARVREHNAVGAVASRGR